MRYFQFILLFSLLFTLVACTQKLTITEQAKLEKAQQYVIMDELYQKGGV